MKAQFEAAQYVHEEAKVFRHNAKIEVRGACRLKNHLNTITLRFTTNM